ncbi:MAG TPA: hypothetical protein DEP84_01635, partial [Chloroflexi bacterium]|nr:hypothetical protein [Chloroflexota bacterium]
MAAFRPAGPWYDSHAIIKADMEATVMKQLIVRVLLVLGLLSFSTACGRTAPGNTPDTRATVAAALAATTTAQAGFEA